MMVLGISRLDSYTVLDVLRMHALYIESCPEEKISGMEPPDGLG